MKDCSRLTHAELIDLIEDLKQKAAANEVQQSSHICALRDSELRLRTILETAVEGIIIIDELGNIESFNPAAEKIFGYPSQLAIGKNVKFLMPEPYRNEHDGYIKSYRHSGHAKIIGIGREVLGRRCDGTIFPMDLGVSEVRLADRRIFAGFVRDISERKKTEKTLQHYAALVESSDDAIIGKTLDGDVTSWNKGAEMVFGYTSEEMLGKPISIIIPLDRLAEEKMILEKISRGESVEHYETIRRRKDGRMVDISVTVSPIREKDGKIVGASKVARNITERKRLENEILEISEREQRRMGNDLHDGLCQELAGIELMCRVLEQKLAAKSKAESKQVGNIALHIREAVTHTRNLAHGLSPVELENNGFMSALRELAANVEKVFRVECRFECPEPVLIQNNAVATHLFRIAQEATNNAIKHGRPKHVAISLKPTREKITLCVTDDGAGIQGGNPNGTGMGMHIMKYRASVVNADLQLRSAAGSGTSVICTFAKNL